MEKMLALSATRSASVGLEDWAGGRAVFSGCWFCGGSGRVEADAEAELEMRFVRPAHDATVSDAPWEGVPAEPGPYEGTHSANVFTAGETALGEYGRLAICVSRRAIVKKVPRCSGVRITPLASGRRTILTLDCIHFHDGGLAQLEAYLRDLHKAIGRAPVVLSGNGNEWSGCRLAAIQSEPDAHWGFCRFRAEFTRDLRG